VVLQQPGKKIESLTSGLRMSTMIERAAVAESAICTLRRRRWHDGMESPL
jgi:hypothetical protein